MKVGGIGEVVFDCFEHIQKQGGAPCNVAMHLGQLGFESYAVIAVGNDILGKEALETIHSYGTKTIDPIVLYETSTVQITLTNGIPQYTIKENVAWDHLELTDNMKQIAQELDMICYGTVAQRSETTRSSIMQFLKLMKPTSHRVFDVNIRQHYYNDKIILDTLQLSTIIKMSDEEIEIIAQACGIKDTNHFEIIKQMYERFSLKYILYTLGDKGSYVYDGISFHFCSATPVTVVNTVGAGDCFTAIFMGCLLKNKPLEECHRLASECAAYVCTQDGAIPQFPSSLLHQL